MLIVILWLFGIWLTYVVIKEDKNYGNGYRNNRFIIDFDVCRVCFVCITLNEQDWELVNTG